MADNTSNIKLIINNLDCIVNFDYNSANNLLIASLQYITKMYINKNINNKTYENLVEMYIKNKHKK